jgi:undecaprenyl-diphosphatase
MRMAVRTWRPLAVRLLAAFLILLLVGAAAGQALKLAPVTRLDQELLRQVSLERSGGLTMWARAISYLGSSALLLPLSLAIALLLLRRRNWREALLIALVVLGVLALWELLKVIVDRPRPPLPHLTQVESGSFPSGHAADALATYGVLAYTLSRLTRHWWFRSALWAIATALVLAIGWSRLYLGVHYLSDILGGYLLAIAWLSVVIILLRLVLDWPRPGTAS